MEQYDVVVAGGGPIGGFIAATLAHDGFKVAIIEEHEQIGFPLQCAGLVTSRVFDLVNLPQTGIVQNEIRGAHIHSPSGTILTVGGDRLQALAIDRSRFDTEIMNRATAAGAQLFLETKILSAQKENNGVVLTTKKKDKNMYFTSDLIIGADGPRSTIRKSFHFPKPQEMLKGIGAEATDTHLDPDFVEIFLGNTIAPGFFAWVIPTNNKGTATRVGLCVTQHAPYPAKHYFTRFLTNPSIKPMFKDATINNPVAGFIPLGCLKKTSDAHVMIVGDAAAQVKPTSGGGIYTGLLCAQQCSLIARSALMKKTYDAKTLKNYHDAWMAKVGKEFQLGMLFRRIFSNLHDKHLDMYIQKLNNQETLDIINTYGDIDYPSKLILPLLKKHPSLLTLFSHYLPRKKPYFFDPGAGGT